MYVYFKIKIFLPVLNSLILYCTYIHMCEIIPDYILRKIAEQKSDEDKKIYYATLGTADAKYNYREKRKRIQDRIRAGEDPKSFLHLVQNDTEHFTVYNNLNSWDLEMDKAKLLEDFIQVDATQKKKPRRLFTRNVNSIHDIFHDTFKRHSFDNKNAVVLSWTKYGKDYDNAYWDGEFLVFGTGGEYFNDFSRVYDVVAHELGHAIQQYESNLEYHAMAGALNEHVSDVFGAVAHQHNEGTDVNESTWLIGEGVFSRKVNGDGIRTFKNELAYDDPVIGKDEQPKHMDNFVITEDDDGGVHINSGIPNHAFYLYNLKLGSASWLNGSFDVWYNTILKSSGLRSNCTFEDFANKTLQVAQNLNKNVGALKEAWVQVGIL